MKKTRTATRVDVVPGRGTCFCTTVRELRNGVGTMKLEEGLKTTSEKARKRGRGMIPTRE